MFNLHVLSHACVQCARVPLPTSRQNANSGSQCLNQPPTVNVSRVIPHDLVALRQCLHEVRVLLTVRLLMQSCVSDLGFKETQIDKIVSASRVAPDGEVGESISYFQMAKSALAQGESMFGETAIRTLTKYAPFHITMMAPLWLGRILHLHEDIIKLSLLTRLGRLSMLSQFFAKVSLKG